MKAGLRRVLVTAGPTREKIDPIRFISNLSTGFMGYEIARIAKNKGYKVTLISGPTNLAPPRGIKFIPVGTARQMSREVKSHLKNSDCLFMASAVCDWRLAKPDTRKIKRAGTKQPALELVMNPDILYEAGKRKRGKILVGFALESANLVKNAKVKLKNKNLDIIAANKVSSAQNPFGKGLTDVLIVTRDQKQKWLRRATKDSVARYLIDKAEKLSQN